MRKEINHHRTVYTSRSSIPSPRPASDLETMVTRMEQRLTRKLTEMSASQT